MAGRLVANDDLVAFRESWCRAFCGRPNRTNKCPENCRIRTLNRETMGSFTIRDMLEVNDEQIYQGGRPEEGNG